MKYQEFIDRNINNIVKFTREYGHSRSLLDAYGVASAEKQRVFNFLDKRVNAYIFNALNKKLEPYGYLAYNSAEGISNYSKFAFNYCIQYKVFDTRTYNHFYISVVFTKNYVYISDNSKHNYRYAWDYETDFSEIFYNWIELYAPDEGIYIH